MAGQGVRRFDRLEIHVVSSLARGAQGQLEQNANRMVVASTLVARRMTKANDDQSTSQLSGHEGLTCPEGQSAWTLAHSLFGDLLAYASYLFK